MVFKNIHSHKTAVLRWQWGMLFLCLVFIRFMVGQWAGFCLSVSVISSVVSQFSKLSLDWADLQRLPGAKRFARDIDLTRSLHHTLICVIIIPTANSVSVIRSTLQKHCQTTTDTQILALMGAHTKAALPEKTPLNNCFYFGIPTLWSTSAA